MKRLERRITAILYAICGMVPVVVGFFIRDVVHNGIQAPATLPTMVSMIVVAFLGVYLAGLNIARALILEENSHKENSDEI